MVSYILQYSDSAAHPVDPAQGASEVWLRLTTAKSSRTFCSTQPYFFIQVS